MRFTATVVQGDNATDSAHPEILGTYRVSLTLETPPIVIVAPESIVEGKSTHVSISMQNPLAVEMSNVVVRVRGYNLDLP